MKILLVEDELALLETIEHCLTRDGYRCESAVSLQAAEEKVNCYTYDVVILDIGLPDGNGLNLLFTLKKNCPETGVLILSAKNSLEDKITGLEWGADDYLTKPFHQAELNARIKSIIRRRQFGGADSIRFHNLEFSPSNNQLAGPDGSCTELTKKEHDLLLYFIANPSRLLTKTAIAEHLWGDYMDLADNFDLVYTHVKNLRKKMAQLGGSNCIKTVYGLGYKFSGY